MKIVLTGATGQLGTDFRKIIPSDILVPLERKDLDFSRKDSIESVLKKIRPDVVINTAAYNKVDEAESNREAAFLINAEAVRNLALTCREVGATLVHYSTDYVFGEESTRTVPYTEEDEPGPISVYGESKLAGEKFIQELMENYFLIRVSALFGLAGRDRSPGNFVETMLGLAPKNKIIKVVNDQILSPTCTLEIAKNSWELIKTKEYGLYHMTSQGQCSWYEFAKKIFELSKLEIDYLPISSEEFDAKAPRPLYSVLENARLKQLRLDRMSSWEKGLWDYLITRA